MIGGFASVAAEPMGLDMPATARPSFAEALRRLRLAAGLSQEALAERSGLSARGLSDLERGARTTPRAETVRLLAEALGLTADERAALSAAAWPASAAAHGASRPSEAAQAAGSATELPRGIVTFLFADIEGAAAHRERDTTGMRAVAERHLELLGAAVAARDGVLYHAVGDAAQAAFPSAAAALAAALDAQRALLAERSATASPLRVRMALNAGDAEPRDGGYLAPALDRTGRLLAAGHGDQILITEAVRQLAGDNLPVGVALRDLGEHRFADLQDIERVFQLVLPDLPANFAPLRSLDWRPHNLPAPLTTFVGREAEVATIQRLLRDPQVRLVTLTGTGGIGKTRLALQAASELVGAFADGVYLVPLVSLTDPALVVSTIARTLAIPAHDGRSPQERLTDYLRERELLLLLDNFEQVIDAGTAVVDLLQACPRVKALVTSREILGVRGEHEFPVPPLALPDPRQPHSTERLTETEGVQLFITRARAVSPTFAVTDGAATVIAEICRRTDCLPLAIELAAARSRIFTPQQLLTRLEHRLATLVGGPRDLPARHQILRDTIAWSYDLLTPTERALFRRVAIFVGGFSLEAAEAVVAAASDAGDRGPVSAGELAPLSGDLLEPLAALAQKGLLRQEPQPGDELRFAMLETIREYGLEQLAAAGEAETMRSQHAAWCVALTEQAEPEVGGPEEKDWLDRLEHEHDNLRAALAGSIVRGDGQTVLRLAAALWRFWHLRGHASEGRQWLERALTAGNGESPEIRAKTLLSLGYLDLGLEDIASGRTRLESALALARALGDRASEANALLGLGRAAGLQGDFTRAQTFHEESLAIRRALGDEPGLVFSFHNLGEIAWLVGDYARAREMHENALRLRERLGDTGGAAFSLYHLGEVAASEGDLRAARELFDKSLAQSQTIDDKLCITDVLCGLARLAHRQGDLREARSLYHESLRLRQETGDRFGIAGSLEGLAGVACGLGQLAQGITIFAAAAARRDAIGTPRPSAGHVAYDGTVAAARSSLGREAFDIAWTRGRAMSIDEAVVFGLSVAADPAIVGQATAAQRPRPVAGLTDVEFDVLRLLPNHSNREIADLLSLRHSAVTAHVASIFAKLGVSSRDDAVAYAVRHDLV